MAAAISLTALLLVVLFGIDTLKHPDPEVRAEIRRQIQAWRHGR